MPKVKLTEAAIVKKRPVGGRVEMWDTVQQGLHIRVSPDGSRIWNLRYQLPSGSYRRLKLGYFVASRADGYGEEFNAEEIEPGHIPLTLTQARAVAGVQRGRVSSKRDPAAEKRLRQVSAREAKSKTVEALADDYLDHQKAQGRKTWRQEEQRLNRDVLPVVGDIPASEVSPQDVERILGRITRRGKRAERSRGGAVQANRVRTLLVSLYNFALLDPDWRTLVHHNPAMLTRRPLKRELPRDRVLTDEEIRGLWETLGAIDDDGDPVVDPVIAAALRLRFLTGQRWTEVRAMEWSEVRSESVEIGGKSVEVAVWLIPSSKSKNGREHMIPLSPQAVEVIDELRLLTGEGNWVFPSPRKPGEHLGECNKAFARWRERAEVNDLRHTDIRRTLATGLSRMGFRLEVRQLVMNHTPQDVTRRHYDRYDFLAEKRQALFRWGAELERIVSGKEELSRVAKIG